VRRGNAWFTHRFTKERTDGQDLVERICGIPPAVRSARGAGRLRLHSEFSSRGHELSDHHPVNHQPSGLTGVA
jgi:hypothetical protein